jgi:uncharacterized membrane-anchored protein
VIPNAQRPTPNARTAAIHGTLRADRRTKELVKRLKPGDIALIHHADLDATAARALLDCKVAAVVNAARSISGRYPNRGPGVLVEADIPLLDAVGDDFFEQARSWEGAAAILDGDMVCLSEELTARGEPLTAGKIAEQLEAARANLSRELDSFARNTLEYLVEEKALLLDPVDVPALDTTLKGRHVMIVVRGEGYQEDLHAISDYLHDARPALIGVDGGADALLAMGLKPDIIIGDMDSVSNVALRCGAELIVHGYTRGERAAPGLPRVEAMGLKAKVFHAPGTSEDVAMLLADEKGASLIVAVGAHFSLDEFLDKGRSGMASTFLVRLRTGSKLVDAKGLGRLWAERRRPSTREMLLLIAAALFPVGVIAVYSPWFRTVINTLRLALRSTFGH